MASGNRFPTATISAPRSQNVARIDFVAPAVHPERWSFLLSNGVRPKDVYGFPSFLSTRRNFTSKPSVIDCKRGVYVESTCLVHGNTFVGVDCKHSEHLGLQWRGVCDQIECTVGMSREGDLIESHGGQVLQQGGDTVEGIPVRSFPGGSLGLGLRGWFGLLHG